MTMSGSRARRERLREERQAGKRSETERRLRRRKLGAAVAIVGLVATVAASAAIFAGGSGLEPAGSPGAPGGAQAQTRGAGGDVLAANREEANELIDGGEEALDAKLSELRGHPVVVNQWGSWCPPCEAEFPLFNEAAQLNDTRVAFLGIDAQDDRNAAEEFLEENPVPYPSIFDPDAAAAFSLGWGQTSPTTWFVDERGEIVHQKPGAYVSRAELEADIREFLLRG